jgi:DeoR family glycerol-3-phosphate regulon repressor
LLSRTHGGAMLASGVENLAYEARRMMAAGASGVKLRLLEEKI